jgi:hypothetical protein
MRVNLEEGEYIIATLPKVWGIKTGLAGFFSKSKEGYFSLTNKNIIFVTGFLGLLAEEKKKYFGDDKARVTRIPNYNESDLDEDISEDPNNSWIIPLSSIVNIESITIRKADFMRLTFKDQNGKETKYDFGKAGSTINYPQRQALNYVNLDWSEWISLIKSHLQS